MEIITWNDFEKIDIRVGTIINVKNFPEARKPSYKIVIDFGAEIGEKKSSAQITDLYTINDLIGRQIIAVINFLPKQIAKFKSECLVLGIYDEHKNVILLQPEQKVSNGMKIG